MRINGDFIEDLERLQEHYERKFIHYSNVYGLECRQKKKYESYKHCVIGMDWLLKLVNEFQNEYWELIKGE